MEIYSHPASTRTLTQAVDREFEIFALRKKKRTGREKRENGSFEKRRKRQETRKFYFEFHPCLLTIFSIYICMLFFLFLFPFQQSYRVFYSSEKTQSFCLKKATFLFEPPFLELSVSCAHVYRFFLHLFLSLNYKWFSLSFLPPLFSSWIFFAKSKNH